MSTETLEKIDSCLPAGIAFSPSHVSVSASPCAPTAAHLPCKQIRPRGTMPPDHVLAPLPLTLPVSPTIESGIIQIRAAQERELFHAQEHGYQHVFLTWHAFDVWHMLQSGVYLTSSPH